MVLVVGLGNPGPKYRSTRHNAGFMVIDELTRTPGVQFSPFREKFRGEFARGTVGSDEIVLLKPLTFMNLSGDSAQQAAAFFKIEPKSIIVVHDELDLPFGTVRLKVGGGAAGHNGIKSMIQHCGPDFIRVRVGIDKPRGQTTEGYVLSDFSSAERAELPDVLKQATEAVLFTVSKGISAAMNSINGAGGTKQPKAEKKAGSGGHGAGPDTKSE